MSSKNEMGKMILTVVVRDESPLRYISQNPIYRSVQIELTEEQKKQIGLKGPETIEQAFFEKGTFPPSICERECK